MENETFAFKSETAPAAGENGDSRSRDGAGSVRSACGVCPISMLPPGAWRKLTRQPFRKRHPLVFWCGLVLLGGILFFSLGKIAADETSMTEKLAYIPVSGPIMDVAPTLQWIREISHNPAVRGALVRVDSPGGGAAASQEIYSALDQLAKKMPVAISMGATAASGGLMVSMAGQRVFANPSTVTGSIGVRMDVPQLQGLMDKLGIGQETLVTAPFKDAVSYTRPMTREDRAYLEQVLMNMHNQFIDIVAKGRRMPREKAASLANGKIFTGQQALALGLIDELGGQQDAHTWLARETGVPAGRKLLVREVSKKRIFERLLGLSKILASGLDELLSLPAASTPQPAFYF